MEENKMTSFNGMIAKVRLTDGQILIASFRRIGDRVELGHPYRVGENITQSGKMGIPSSMVASVTNASKSDVRVWAASYYDFHDDVLMDKGYDSCEEDVDSLMSGTVTSD